MTSIQPVSPWTNEIIKKDKELKDIYGQNAHIIPAPVDFTKGGDMFVDSNKIDLIDKKQKKNIKKLLLGAAAVATTFAGTLIAIKYLKKGKLPSIQGITTGGKIQGGPKPGFKLSDLKFEKGKAFLQSGEKFSGTVSHELKNGNKVSMVYKNGQIQSSIIKDKEGKILTQKEYKYRYRSSNCRGDDTILDKVLVDRNGVKSSVEFERDWFGHVVGTKVVTPEKTITFKESAKVETGLYHSAEEDILTTGLRENMPFRKWESGGGGSYPNAQIIDVEDATGHTITRKFENGMKDVLKLDKQGTTGTIEHFDENGKLVSKIERTFDHEFKDFETSTETFFGGGTYEVGTKIRHLHFNDVVYDAKGNIIANRKNYINASTSYGWV